MSNTASHADQHTLRQKLDWLIRQPDRSIPPAFTQAIESFLTALAYEDTTLMMARLHEALEALRESVDEGVQRRLGWPKRSKELCREIFQSIEGSPGEDFDEVGRKLESWFDELLKSLAEILHGPVKLLEAKGHKIESASKLENEIKELQEIKANVLATWPWSTQELPPVHRGMVAASRAAIARKEGEPIEVLVRRLSGASAQGD